MAHILIRKAHVHYASNRLSVKDYMDTDLEADLAIRYPTQRLVDDEIERLKSNIRSFLSHRNTLSPISRLPSEILSHIFALTQPPEDSDQSKEKSFTSFDWIVVSHVCRAWRFIALGCATLWTGINSSHRFMDLFMERSEGAVLRCDMDARRGKIDPILRLLQQVRRTSYIHLRVSHKVSAKVFASLCTPAPLLRSLIILYENTDASPYAVLPITNNVALPENTFAGTSTNLSTLSLTGCGIPPNARILSTVTSLSIISPGATYTRSQWLAALASMPHLAQLTLDNAFDDASPDAGSPTARPLSTLCLSKLVLKGKKFLSDIAFFNHFTVSNEAEVSFSSETSAWANELILFLRSHATVRQELSKMPIHRMSVEHKTDTFVFRAQIMDLGSVKQHPLLVSFELLHTGDGMGISMEPNRRDRWIEALATLPLANLVCFDSAVHMPRHLWPILLKHAPKTSDIWVTGDDSNSFFEYLLDNYTKTCPGSKAPQSHQKSRGKKKKKKKGEFLKRGEWTAMALPALKKLTLERCDMVSLPNADPLCDVFTARTQNGAPLDLFFLVCCETYDDEWASRMKKAVPLDWDGDLPEDDEGFDDGFDDEFDGGFDDGFDELEMDIYNNPSFESYMYARGDSYDGWGGYSD